jgi:hypothetical protein
MVILGCSQLRAVFKGSLGGLMVFQLYFVVFEMRCFCTTERKLQAKMAPKLNSGTADPQIIAWATQREESHEEHEPIVAALMDAGADPTIMDCNGNTAITMASKTGHERIIEMLNGRHNETDAVPTA